jgi:uncharacterized protein (DUF433 family)
MNLIERITINPAVCHGKPTIRSMRYPVEFIIDLLSSGMTFSDIMNDYPAIEENDILACLLYASQLTKMKGNKPKMSKFFGALPNIGDGLQIQKSLRDEWV